MNRMESGNVTTYPRAANVEAMVARSQFSKDVTETWYTPLRMASFIRSVVKAMNLALAATWRAVRSAKVEA